MVPYHDRERVQNIFFFKWHKATVVSFYVTRYPEKEATDRQQTAHCGVTDLQCDPHTKHHVVVGKTLVYMEPAQPETAFSHVVHDVQVAVLLKLLLRPQDKRRVDVDRSQYELGILAKGFHFADVVILYVTR